MDNLVEMDKFLEITKSTKAKSWRNRKSKHTNYGWDCISEKKSLPTRKSLGPNGFSGKIYQIFDGELT